MNYKKEMLPKVTPHLRPVLRCRGPLIFSSTVADLSNIFPSHFLVFRQFNLHIVYCPSHCPIIFQSEVPTFPSHRPVLSTIYSSQFPQVATYADRPGYQRVSSTLWKQREDYCAALIQKAWKFHKLRNTESHTEEPHTGDEDEEENSLAVAAKAAGTPGGGGPPRTSSQHLIEVKGADDKKKAKKKQKDDGEEKS